MSISVIIVKIPPLDILHKVSHKTQNTRHKTPQYLKIPLLNTNSSSSSISRCSPLATLALAGKCEEIQGVSWNQVQCNNAKLLLGILEGTSFQLEPDTKSPLRSISETNIPEEARAQLQELYDLKYINITSIVCTMDIGRTNLIDLDIPTPHHLQALHCAPEILQVHGPQK